MKRMISCILVRHIMVMISLVSAVCICDDWERFLFCTQYDIICFLIIYICRIHLYYNLSSGGGVLDSFAG